ncbi:MAG: S49 family peptidase [Pseudomonadales bacterium]|jgi:protease-4
MSQDLWNEQEPGQSTRPGNDKEWQLIEKLLMQQNKESRRARRWGVFFKLLTFGYLFVILFLFTLPNWMGDSSPGIGGSHTALVDINGVISDQDVANADTIVTGLRNAFESANTKGVILRINSPGGSPVQSGYVYDEIMRLKGLYPNVKVYAVISDIGASGAYYIAAAADEIYADKASLVGSIGVISSSFGFVDTLDKLGIERRVFTAGESKAFLDPFSPMKESDKDFWQGVLSVTHQQFINQVKKGRGDRLTSDDKVFSGLIWTGEQALELGLVDGLGSTGFVAREVIGEENIVDFTLKRTPFEEFADRLGIAAGAALANQLGIGAAAPNRQ